MTSAFSGGDVAGVESQIEGLIPTFQQYASDAAGMGDTLFGQGATDIYPTSLAQFQAGAAGQVTPAQQAAIDQTAKEMDLQTTGTYGNLGLGNSTMEAQDLDANKQKSLAQTVGFSSLDEELGLSGLKTAQGFESGGVTAEGTAGSILGQGASALAGVGNLAAGQEALQMQTLGSIGSALGGKL
jgi:hypothetical protein